jgi:phosphate transport system substrate-binding protein
MQTARETYVPRRKIAAALLLAGSLVLATTTAAQAQVDTSVTLTGAGATFPLNVIDQWKADFKRSTGVTINYTGVGSGGGRAQFINGTVDFGASDVPASSSEAASMKRKHGGFFHIVETAGAIGITYNVKGVPGGIKLTGADIGQIFSGKVQYWDDKIITDDNPDVSFPHTPVQVFVRSDSSGTSSAFTEYLSEVNGRENWEYGVNSRFPTNRQQIGRSGNDGVANAVRSTEGGIGYVEVSFAKERGLALAWVKNAAGEFRPSTGKSPIIALDQAKLNADGTWKMGYKATTAGMYPITTVSYLLVPARMDAKKLGNFQAFMDYVLSAKGQAKASKLSYLPLTKKFVDAAKANLAKITAKK